MHKRLLAPVAIALFSLMPLATERAMAREKWPAQTEESKRAAETTKKHEEEVWQKIQPEIADWAKKGKPYIPWAAKPEDLPQAGVPAFPGAQGGGAHSFGGRGGKVYVVTSLEDSGPGTFREACEAAGPRIVVFNVAGIIHLKSRILIRAPYITIAGQTAPGDGVCVAGDTTAVETHDAVIRYMRFRRGQMDVYNRDDALGGNPVGNIIVDHCSCSWGFDENLSMYRHMYDPKDGTKELKLPTVNITIQNCISSEALDTFNHAFGGTWGGHNCTFYHDLFACNTGRNPSIGMNHEFNFVNNVLFNWRHRTMDGGDETTLGNCINNYYKPGPITPNAPIRYRVVKVDGKRGKNIVTPEYGKWYVAGNVVEGNEAVTKDNWAGGVQFGDNTPEDAAPTSNEAAPEQAKPEPPMKTAQMAAIRADKPFPMVQVPIQSARDSYDFVLANAGATLPKRDPVDVRIIDEVRTGKVTYTEGKGIITDPKQVGGYPEYKGQPYKDSDSDGIPDDWETKNGLNPNDASDAAKIGSDGYSNIEKYLNSVVPASSVSVGISTTTAPDDVEAKYTRDIEKRTADILALLDIQNDAAKTSAVHDIIINQYRTLRDWHDANDAKLKSKDTSDTDKQQVRESLKKVHDEYIGKLSAQLTPEQIEKVKDKMTYGKVQFTFKGYMVEYPNLTQEQQAKVLELLKEARELAMDGGSSKEKDDIFNKYKGKINNYLSSQGIASKNKKAKSTSAPTTQAAQ